MLKKPARILAIAMCIAMLVAVSADATRLDFASIDGPSQRTAPMVRLPGHVLPALAKAKPIESAPNAGDSPMMLTLVLKRDDQKGFERYLHDVYDPHSRSFHHFVTQREISDRFGPSQKNYDAVLAYLQQRGFKLVEGSANHLTITVRGTRAIAEGTFDTSRPIFCAFSWSACEGARTPKCVMCHLVICEHALLDVKGFGEPFC